MAKSSDIIKIGFDYRASLEQFVKETNGVFDGISEKAGKQRISIQLDAKNDKVIEKIYQPYYNRYKTSFSGFFTDEPQMSRNGIPWSFVYEEEYKKRVQFLASAKQPTLRLKLANGVDSLRQSKIFITHYSRYINT